MKTRCILPLLVLSSAAYAAELNVRLKAAPPAGTLAFELFDSANTFGDFRDPVRVFRLPLDGRPSYNLTNLPTGEYALLVYHDANENQRIDKNFIGIPKEPLAFSNGYRPKGPPSFKSAAFLLKDEGAVDFDLQLYKPLGERGRIGVGLGLLARSSPYRNYNGGVFQAFPSIVYTGNRLQIYGPRAQLGIAGSGKLRLALQGRYRMSVYEEDQSNYLSGMGDAASTFVAGPALQAELPGGLDVSVGYSHDTLDRIGGGEARLDGSKSFQFGKIRLSPMIALNWMSADMAANDFGVAPKDARADRPAYDPGPALSMEAGSGLFYEITPDWILLINCSVERLGDEVTHSPIVSAHYVLKGFCALSYIF